MKVLMINDYGDDDKEASGAERIVNLLKRELEKKGHLVKKVSPPPEMGAGDLAFQCGLVEKQICDFKPDIVHFHNIVRWGLQLILYCRSRKIPHLITVHDYWPVCRCRQFFRWSELKVCDEKHQRDCTVGIGGANCIFGLCHLPTPAGLIEVLKDTPMISISNFQMELMDDFGYRNVEVIYNGI